MCMPGGREGRELLWHCTFKDVSLEGEACEVHAGWRKHILLRGLAGGEVREEQRSGWRPRNPSMKTAFVVKPGMLAAPQTVAVRVL